MLVVSETGAKEISLGSAGHTREQVGVFMGTKTVIPEFRLDDEEENHILMFMK